MLLFFGLFFNFYFKLFGLTLYDSSCQFGYLLLYYLNSQSHNILIVVGIILIFYQKPMIKYMSPLLLYIWIIPVFLLDKIPGTYWPDALIVGLNNLHPLLYYWGFGLVAALTWNFFYIYTNYCLLFVTYITTTTLILGMYWGSLNDVWGFFWVDDIIEVILLCMVLALLVYIHLYAINVVRYISVFFLFLLLSLATVRLGLVSTRHSFFLDIQIASFTNYLYGVPMVFLINLNFVIFGLYLVYCNFFNLGLIFISLNLLQINFQKNYIQKYGLLYVHILISILIMFWLFSLTNYNTFYNIKFFTKYFLNFNLDGAVLYGENDLFLNDAVSFNQYKLLDSLTDFKNLNKISYHLPLITINYGYIFSSLLIILSTYKIYKN